MITILVFDACPHILADVNTPSQWRPPSEHLQQVVNWIRENPNLTIRAYSDDLLNLIGHLIHRGTFSADQFVVKYHTDDLHCATYDSEGLLQNWHYGLMQPNFSEIT